MADNNSPVSRNDGNDPGAPGDPLLSRIDALVKRRRSFVAADATPPAARQRDDEDVPLLTEIIDLGTATGSADREAPVPLEPLIQALAADLAHALEYRLQADLPGVLDAAFERLASDLRRGIAGVAESAVRDFLGRQQQLRLPFPSDTEK